MKKSAYRLSLFIIMLTVCVGMFLVYSSSYIRGIHLNLQKEAETTLSEATVQAANSINSKIQGELSVLDGIADTLSQGKYRDKDDVQRYLERFVKKYNYTRMSISTVIGTEVASDNTFRNACSVSSFQSGLSGKSSISFPSVDILSNQEMLTFTSPIIVNGMVEAVLCATKLTEEIYDSYSVTFFEGKGVSYLVDSKGEIVLGSGYLKRSHSFHNIFEWIGQEAHNQEALDKFQDDLALQPTGVGMFLVNGTDKLIGYSKIEDVNDWYMISFVPREVVMKNADHIIQSTYRLCMMIFGIFLLIFIYFILTRRTQHRKIEKLAYSDELTGIYNLNKFRISARHLLNKYHTQSYAIVQFDINHFKYVNEVCGYQVGDQILKFMADTLSEDLLSHEIIGRSSGDRFVMLTEYDDEVELSERLKEVNQALSSYRHAHTQGFKLIVSCGVYQIMDPSMDINTMIDRSLMACNTLKGSHESSIAFFDEELRNQIVDDQELESRMYTAIDNKEFVVYLQPKYDLIGNQVCGAEALVRWDHPQRGLMMPIAFIPLFERNGFITNIDLAVLEVVCQLIRKWLDQGMTAYPISVNISRKNLFHVDFVNQLKGIVERHNISPEFIELELTESVVFDRIDVLRSTLLELKSIGFMLSIDDFGTGYSSLNLLDSIPIDVIKLDRGFIVHSFQRNSRKVVVKNVIGMAKELNIKVVSEGVETLEQVEFLQSIHCDYAQGYYFSRPMPIEQFERLTGMTPSSKS